MYPRRNLYAAALLLALAGIARPIIAQTAPLHSEIDLSAIDRTVPPWENLFQFANGNWQRTAEIPADHSRIGSFITLADRNREIVRDAMEAAARDTTAPKNSVPALVGRFYHSGMDEAAIEAAGAKPVQPDLDMVASVQSVPDLMKTFGTLQRSAIGGAFRLNATPDNKDSRRTIAAISQGGLSLPAVNYYTDNTPRSRALLAALQTHIGKMFALLGDRAEDAEAASKSVIALETRLAKASKTRLELRDPIANYNKISFAQVEALAPGIPWKAYFDGLQAGPWPEFNVGQPKFLTAFGQMLTDVPLSDWKTYLRWRVLSASAPYLSSAFEKEAFRFQSSTLTGAQEMRPRWERVQGTIEGSMGQAIGQLYVARAFSPEARKRAEKMVLNIKAELRERLTTLAWMSEPTRQEALKKLDAIKVKVGYPDKWRDYSHLKLDSGSYLQNVREASAANYHYNLAKIGKPTDKSEWGMNPQVVNASYSPDFNAITIPAGILQPPFYDPNADDALNYGRIGMVVGHELTHGFDDQGRQFDAEGNLRDWWTPEDAKAYTQRADQIATLYSSYEVQEGLNVNGRLTLGENIADLGGTKIAYLAFLKTLGNKPQTVGSDGFTPSQRFFVAMAQLWRGKNRPELERNAIATDPHSPNRFRVNGPVTNMPEFFAAFHTPADATGPYRNPTPAEIW